MAKFKKGDKVTVREGATSVTGHTRDPKEVRTVVDADSWGSEVQLNSTGRGGNIFREAGLIPVPVELDSWPASHDPSYDAPYRAPISTTPSDFPLDEVVWLDDSTPAPLNASKVKAGDTVTLTRDGGEVRGEMRAITFAQNHQRAWTLQGGLQVQIEGPNAWTLTDHQPAPEPEYRSQFVTVRENDTDAEWAGFVDAEGDFYGMEDGFRREAPSGDFTPIRPLVVIDPAAVDVDALAQTYGRAYGTALDGSVYTRRKAALRAALAELGIEAF